MNLKRTCHKLVDRAVCQPAHQAAQLDCTIKTMPSRATCRMRNVFNFYLQVNAAAARQVQIKRISHSKKKGNSHENLQKSGPICKFRAAKVCDAPEKLLKICGKLAHSAEQLQVNFVESLKNVKPAAKCRNSIRHGLA